MAPFVSAGVHAELKIEMAVRPEDPSASITFGHERITLDFCDPEPLERLRDLAAEAARQIRAAATGIPEQATETAA
jgi:D-mannonate dehydratase